MKKANGPRLTLGYVRVSSSEQADHGVSLAAQQHRLNAYAQATERTLSDTIEDAGESAKSLKRPGMTRLLAAVQAGDVGTVLIVKLDRLTRSVRDLADLLEVFERYGVSLVSLSESLDTSTAAGRLMLNLLASVSQWEREAIGERTEFALAHLRRNRIKYAKVPFGYRCDGSSLIEDPEEAWALRSALRMRARGESLSRIGAWLQASGFAPHQGGKAWRPSSVSAILTSRMTRAL